MKTPCLWLLLFLALTAQAQLAPTNSPPTVQLAWDPEDSATFNIYWGTASGVYTQVVFVGSTNWVSIVLPARGITYYFAATAIVGGLESGYSDEVTWTPPLPPNPPHLKKPLLVAVQFRSMDATDWTDAGLNYLIAPGQNNLVFRLQITQH